jgi:hypothetical protein
MIEKLVIDRATWRVGGFKGARNIRYGNTELLNKEGMKCCLGFLATECGYTDKEIYGVVSPWELKTHDLGDKEGYFDKLVSKDHEDFHTDFGAHAIQLNDHSSLSDEERERDLKELFKKNGIDVEFIGEYDETNN